MHSNRAGEAVLAFVWGAVPFAVGTVALGSVTIVSSIGLLRDETVATRASIDRLAQIVINEAKLAESRRTPR